MKVKRIEWYLRWFLFRLPVSWPSTQMWRKDNTDRKQDHDPIGSFKYWHRLSALRRGCLQIIAHSLHICSHRYFKDGVPWLTLMKALEYLWVRSNLFRCYVYSRNIFYTSVEPVTSFHVEWTLKFGFLSQSHQFDMVPVILPVDPAHGGRYYMQQLRKKGYVLGLELKYSKVQLLWAESYNWKTAWNEGALQWLHTITLVYELCLVMVLVCW